MNKLALETQHYRVWMDDRAWSLVEHALVPPFTPAEYVAKQLENFLAELPLDPGVSITDLNNEPVRRYIGSYGLKAAEVVNHGTMRAVKLTEKMTPGQWVSTSDIDECPVVIQPRAYRYVAYEINGRGDAEKWRAVVGFEDLYEVSDQGRVRNAATLRLRKLHDDGRGYMQVSLGGKATKKVHRLVLEAFTEGRLPKDAEARHLNGNSTDNRLCNLRWGTHADNERDKVRHGTDNSGERCATAKLTAEDVRWIRKRAMVGEKTETLARDYAVARRTIQDIVAGKTWGSVAAEPRAVVDSAAPVAEWPKWELSKDGRSCVRWDAPKIFYTFREHGTGAHKGVLTDEAPYGQDFDFDIITPTEAAKWLRANGHADAADKIEKVASVKDDEWAGARVWKDLGGVGCNVWVPRMGADGRTIRHSPYGHWHCEGVPLTCLGVGEKELHGPEAAAVIAECRAAIEQEKL